MQLSEFPRYVCAANIILMKRSQRNTLQFSIKDHEFVITLDSIRSVGALEGVYTLELDKGCRHIQTLQEPIEFGKSNKHVFQSTKPVSVRAYKEKNMNFAWSLYKLEDDMYEFVDSFNINFQDAYLRYIEEIRNSSFEYSRICQLSSLGQELRGSWALMKLHLKFYSFRQTIKNSNGNLTLEFSVDIRNEFDRITEKQAKITHKKPEKEVDQKSTSSRNSLMEKKKVKFVEQEPTKYKQSELKVDSLIKVQQSELEANHEEQQKKSEDSHLQQKSKYSLFLPIQTLLKSNTMLSDIIQASNEGESHLNTGDRSERKASESLLQPPLSAKTYVKTNTYNFQNAEEAEEPYKLKRNNSEDHLRREQEEEEHELIRVSEVSEGDKDSMTKESTIIRAESNLEFIPLQTPATSYKKYVLLIFFAYVILGRLLWSQVEGEVLILKQSKKERIKKDEFSIDRLFSNSLA